MTSGTVFVVPPDAITAALLDPDPAEAQARVARTQTASAESPDIPPYRPDIPGEPDPPVEEDTPPPADRPKPDEKA